MGYRAFLMLLVLGLSAALLPACGGGGSKPQPQPDPYALPAADGTTVRLYTPATTLGVNQDFEIKVVFYGLTNALGAAFEISYPSDRIQIQVGTDTVNPRYFQGAPLHVGPTVEDLHNLVSYAVSYENATLPATPSIQAGDGVVLLLHCRTKLAGAASISLIRSTLEIRQPDGSMMSGSESWRLGDLTVQVLGS